MANKQRLKYTGDVFAALMKKGWSCTETADFVNSFRDADAVPVVHGRWICLEPEIGLYECSECGHRILRAECNFCPNCGAKMEVGNHENRSD